MSSTRAIKDEEAERFRSEGYLVVEGLFSPTDVKTFIDHYMAMHDRGGDGWAEGGVDMTSTDPLKRYPRLLQPHRGDAISLNFMLDARIKNWMIRLLGAAPYGVQTMIYFKPAGARGQAPHQDQRYLRADPGTCVAAWLALDDCDEENGCMMIVPGSQDLPMICPVSADMGISFTGDTVPIPPGMAVKLLPMKSGDVLFFNGSLIHGSMPNRSTNRFRRILVGHYIEGSAESVATYYHPIFNWDGSIVELKVSDGGGACGEFVNGEFRINGTVEAATRAH